MRLPEKEKDIVMKSRDSIMAVPALLLCAVTLVMLILDLTLPVMSDYQYMIYPLLVKCTGLAGLICAAMCIRDLMNEDHIRLDAGSLCFLLFLICIAISTCVNGFNRDALLGVQFRYIGIFDMLSFFLAYMLCSRNIKGENIRRNVLTAIAAVSDIIAVVFLTDHFALFVEAFKNKNEPAAIFFHGNHYGYFIVIAVIISAGLSLYGSSRQRMFGIFSFALNIAALSINRSTGCILATGTVLLAGAIVMFIRNKESRKGIILIAAFLAALTAVVLKYEPLLAEDAMMDIRDAVDIITGEGNGLHGHGRWGLWQQTVGLIKERPLFGYGCEGISKVLLETNVAANPHNEVMTYAAYYGIPAAVIYFCGVLITISRGLRSGSRESVTAACAAAAYFMSSMFGVSMFYTSPFFFVLLGLSQNPNVRSDKIGKTI